MKTARPATARSSLQCDTVPVMLITYQFVWWHGIRYLIHLWLHSVAYVPIDERPPWSSRKQWNESISYTAHTHTRTNTYTALIQSLLLAMVLMFIQLSPLRHDTQIGLVPECPYFSKAPAQCWTTQNEKRLPMRIYRCNFKIFVWISITYDLKIY